MPTRDALPTGTVTFLFSDIEGSTRLVQQLGDRFVAVLEDQQRILREVFAARGGTELGTEGDSFFIVFQTAPDAVAAALDAQRAIAAHPWPDDAAIRIRMGLHTGEGTLGGANYVGLDVNRAARIAAAAHGGQVLISESTRVLIERNLPQELSVRDLGEHRLKDLLKPERIFQLVHDELPSDFPPLATLSYRPNNLPTQTSEFVGRDGEIAAICELLDGAARLITLTGPGGIGKTRLALQAAAARVDVFEDGLYLVELSSTRDPAEAFETLARTVGVDAFGDARPLDALKEQLATKHMLLLLDNLEQVIEAAPDVADLLRSCARLKVIATSREALRVRGEHIFPVPTMSLPPAGGPLSAEDAAASEAVRLFVERAAEASGSFALTDDNAGLVAEICARLDGLPLAIELAAARARLFSLEDLRNRLKSSLQVVGGGARDLPARHQTLRGTIEWSYDLLDDDERNLFRCLSVFATAELSAVEHVATRIEPLRDVVVVDRVASLVDKSLIRSVNGTGPLRLSMLGTIQEFAIERLDREPDLAAETRRAHAEFFSEFARVRGERLSGAGRDEALKDLDVELGNLLAAWRFWLWAGDLERLEELLDPLWALHDARGWYVSAVSIAQDLLVALSAAPSTPERAERRITLAMTLARGLLALRGYTKEVEEAFGRAFAMLDESGSLPQLYPVLRHLASLHLYRAEFEQALSIGRQLLELAERSDDDGLRIDAHLVVGANLLSLGSAEGLDHLAQVIDLFDPARHQAPVLRLGPNPGVVAHTSSAFAYWLLGEPDRARRHSAQALENAAILDHPYSTAYALFHTGFLNLWQRDIESVFARSEAAFEVAEKHGYDVWRAVALVLQGTALVALGRPDDGLARSDRGLALYQQLTAPPVFWPALLTIRAAGLTLAGRVIDALALIDQAIEMQEGQFDLMSAEVPVFKGDLLLGLSQPDDAEKWYHLAYDVARSSGARTTELRAATRLTMLWRQAGKQPDGTDALREAYETFAGKGESLDLAEARAVLESR